MLEFSRAMNAPMVENKRPARHVLQIVPFRTSRADGIGDYARDLAGGLRTRHGVETTFLSGAPAGTFPPPTDDWPTKFVAAQSAEALFAALREAQSDHQLSSVIVHAGGYGYARRGVPFWLLYGLRRWRAHADRAHVFAIFHELYATGKPWNSSFWLGPLQRHVARQIWHVADAGLTTNTRYRDELVAWRPSMADRTVLMPVPSTVGEPVSYPASNDRPRRAAVFGAAGIEDRIYGTDATGAIAALTALGIAEIVDIGSRRTPPPSEIAGIGVRTLGRLPADAVSRHLLECRFGLMSYDTTRLGKSTVFAAYAAHGVVPICVDANAAPADGLRNGEHFLHPPIAPVDDPGLTRIQAKLTDWYSTHATVHLVDSVAHFGLPCSPHSGGSFDQKVAAHSCSGEPR